MIGFEAQVALQVQRGPPARFLDGTPTGCLHDFALRGPLLRGADPVE